MTYDEAVIAMVDANIQRENVLPSEKAFAYKMKIDALSRQGYRSDLTCAPVGHKLANARSRDIVAEQSGESKSQVQRYVRLTHLNPDLLDMVDGGSMAMRPAVEISYLSEREQDDLLDAMGMEACTPSHAQAIRMRRLSEQGALSREAMASIMGERKPNQVEDVYKRQALFLRTAAQRAKPNRIVAAWATFSALYSLSSIIPILVNLQGYLQELAEVRMMGEEYVNVYKRQMERCPHAAR